MRSRNPTLASFLLVLLLFVSSASPFDDDGKSNLDEWEEQSHVDSFPSVVNSNSIVVVGIMGILLIQAIVLYIFGQPPISQSGRVQFWNGDIFSRENSQQLTDHYTFTHILHGIILYGAMAVVVPNYSIQTKVLLAFGMESVWEIVENSPQIIKRYRESALAQGYTGDTIINSISDTMAMGFGFMLAYTLPIWLVILLSVVEEAVNLYNIRDNLVLNVIALVYPIETISNWQTDIRKKTNHYSS